MYIYIIIHTYWHISDHISKLEVWPSGLSVKKPEKDQHFDMYTSLCMLIITFWNSENGIDKTVYIVYGEYHLFFLCC